MAFVEFNKGLRFFSDFSESASDGSWSVDCKTLRGGLSDGLEIIEVIAGDFSFTILPSKGMGLWKGKFKNLNLGWNSPVLGPVNPNQIELERRNGLGWLDGFDEWFCRCGLVSNGPPGNSSDGNRYTLHGRIANLPAHHLSFRTPNESTGVIEIKGIVEESALFSPKLVLETTYSIEVGSNSLKVVDKVKNLGSSKADFQLLYHCNIGQPFLSENSYWIAPLSEIAPQTKNASLGMKSYGKFEASQPGFKEQVFLCKPLQDKSGKSFAMMVNPILKAGFVIKFDAKALPCFTVWKNMGSGEEGYVVGLEPATNYPNFIDFEKSQNRFVSLKPNEEWIAELRLQVLTNANEVLELENQILSMQTIEVKLHLTPGVPFSP